MPGKKKRGGRRRHQRGGDFGNLLWEKYRKMHPTWTNQQVSDYVARDDRGWLGNLFDGITNGAPVAIEVGKKIVPAVIDVAKNPDNPGAYVNVIGKTVDATNEQLKKGGRRRRRPKKIMMGRGPTIIF